MSDEILRELREIRDQLAAIQFAVTRPTRTRTPKAKPPPRTAYSWFNRSWGDADIRSLLLERIPSFHDAFEDPDDDPVIVYRSFIKDARAIVRVLFEAQRAGD